MRRQHHQRMVMRGVSLYLLLGHLLIGAGSTCVPVECLICNTTGKPQEDPCAFCNPEKCSNDASTIPSNCKQDFQVSVNCSKSNLQEGDDITLTCVHNLTVLITMFGWKRNQVDLQEGKNKSILYLKEVLSNKAGLYTCFVESLCGDYVSPPCNVNVENQSVLILVICGISALGLVLIMGLAMKFKLKRDNAKHKERRRQKAEAEQRSGPAPFTLRES
ncbi:uncharacterized protein LOC120566726 isoform X2 [Perca fluviatilis]|uniref:uncharacterized protein LOC120566726 isoform X2 n=1 Tax=Perca fluviatilis TaxID=8168 RepID=UPI001962A8E7|nr:uncharacterized protein LOC120566726 isoform X2 [Perca fluviatilis]